MSEIKIGSVIKSYLREKRRSLKDVSRETGIPYSTLHTWLENRQPKDLLKAQRLADYFGMTLHYLIFESEDSRQNAKPDAETAKENNFMAGTFEIVVQRID